MTATIELLVSLLGVIAVVAFVAARSNIPPSILLVLTGVILALIPGLPAVALEVSPLFGYDEDSFAASWRELASKPAMAEGLYLE